MKIRVGVTGSRFFVNKQTSDVFMLSNRAKGLVFWDANGLNPFFGKLMSKEVDAKMNEWAERCTRVSPWKIMLSV